MQILAEDDRGYVGFEAGELIIGSKVFDPPKVRLTSPVNIDGGGGGVLSFNISRQVGIACDGHQQDEIAMIRVEQAQDVRGQLGNKKAEMSAMLADGSGIGDVVKPLAFVWDAVTTILPAFAMALRSALLGTTDPPVPVPTVGDYDGAEFIGSLAKFKYARQVDGHDVLYNARGVAIWVSEGGINGTWMNR